MKARPAPKVSFEVTLTLTEDEARAIDAVCGYNMASFLEVFYAKMGRSYLQPHEHGWRSFAEAVRSQIGPQLHQVDEARAVIRGERIERWMSNGAAVCIGLIRMGEAIAARATPPIGEAK